MQAACRSITTRRTRIAANGQDTHPPITLNMNMEAKQSTTTMTAIQDVDGGKLRAAEVSAGHVECKEFRGINE